jgi:hypothetical protein
LSREANQNPVELLFWTKIMSEHARLIKDSLLPDNPNQVLIAGNIFNTWEKFSHKLKASRELDPDLTDELINAGLSFREFLRELLGSSLGQGRVTTLAPSFYNHLLNELEEFLKNSNEIQTRGGCSGVTLGTHLVWVLDAAGHAALIGSNLDQAEALYREEARAFESAFNKMYLKAVELAGYYRGGPAMVQPILLRFNRQITELLQEFIKFLSEIQAGLAQHQIAGNLHSWLLDHMIREEHYYLKKIGAVPE